MEATELALLEGFKTEELVLLEKLLTAAELVLFEKLLIQEELEAEQLEQLCKLH